MFTKKCRQPQNFDSHPKEKWHYNHVTFTPIANNFMLYCKLIYMLSMLYVRLITIKGKVRIPERFKVGWYPPITGSSHLNCKLGNRNLHMVTFSEQINALQLSISSYYSVTDLTNLFLITRVMGSCDHS